MGPDGFTNQAKINTAVQQKRATYAKHLSNVSDLSLNLEDKNPPSQLQNKRKDTSRWIRQLGKNSRCVPQKPRNVKI